jgi:hypothetical protein
MEHSIIDNHLHEMTTLVLFEVCVFITAIIRRFALAKREATDLCILFGPHCHIMNQAVKKYEFWRCFATFGMTFVSLYFIGNEQQRPASNGNC